MERKLSKEREKLVLENEKLVYYTLNKLGVEVNSVDYEDYASIGKIGLIRAAIKFDEEKGKNFSTYAFYCIKHEIFEEYMKRKKYFIEVSIDEPIFTDKSYKEMTMKDIIKDEKSCFIEETEDQDCFIKILDVILNYLEGKNRLTLLYRMGNVKENEIAEKLHVAWKYVTVIYKKAIRKVRKAMEYNIKYKKVFQIEVVHNKYKISFSLGDIKKFRKICNEILKKEKERDFSGIEIAYAKNWVEILMPANFQSFYFMAQVILESDMKK